MNERARRGEAVPSDKIIEELALSGLCVGVAQVKYEAEARGVSPDQTYQQVAKAAKATSKHSEEVLGRKVPTSFFINQVIGS